MKYIVNLFLSFCTLVFLFVFSEITYRFYLYIQDQQTFSRVYHSDEFLPKLQSPAALAHIIRPSTNKRIIYELRPNISVDLYRKGDRVTTNDYGFRNGKSIKIEKGDTFRVLGIGDSFMFGQGVSDGQSYLSVAQNILLKQFPIEIINTAVPGYNTSMEVEVLKEKGLKFKPDVVVIEFVGNDFALPNFIRNDTPVFSLSHLFFFEYLHKSLVKNLPKSRDASGLESLGLVSATRDPFDTQQFASKPEMVPEEYRSMVGWRAYSNAIRELAELAKLHNFKVVFITLKPDHDETTASVFKLAKQHNFVTLDLGQDIRNYMSEHNIDNYLGSVMSQSLIDGHPSALTHRIAGKRLAKQIQELKYWSDE